MNIKSRLQKLESFTTSKGQEVYIVDLTAEEKYKFSSNGKELTKAEFMDFMNSKKDSIFIIDDIPRVNYEIK